MNANQQLSLLREACHTRDTKEITALLNSAPDIAWSYACDHGLAPLDWATTDRAAYLLVPGTHTTLMCSACWGQGIVSDVHAPDTLRICLDCVGEGYTAMPTPWLWVARSCVTREAWTTTLGTFSAPYLAWLQLPQNRHRWRSACHRKVETPDGSTHEIVAPDFAYEPSNAEPLRYCNALSSVLGKQNCYTATDEAWKSYPLCFSGYAWTHGRAGYRLPTFFEWQAMVALGAVQTHPVRFELCWSKGPAERVRLRMFARSKAGEFRFWFYGGDNLDGADRARALFRPVRVAPMP